MNKVILGVAVITFCLPFAAFAKGDNEADNTPMPRGGNYAQSSQLIADEEGILVTGVVEDSPAAKAGIIRGDIVLAVDGKEVNTIAELQELLADYEAGQTVKALVSRGGEEITIEVTLETRLYRPAFGIAGGGYGYGPGRGDFDMPQGRMFNAPGGRGYMMPGDDYRGRAPFSEDQRPFRFQMNPDGAWGQGMMYGDIVQSVVDGSPAATAGIVAGDIIVKIGETELTDQTIGEAVKALSPGDKVELEIVRHNAPGDFETLTVTVTLGRNDDGGAYLGISYAPMGYRFMGDFMGRFDNEDSQAYPRGFRGMRALPEAEEPASPETSM